MSDKQRVAGSFIVNCGGLDRIIVALLLCLMQWLHSIDQLTRFHRSVTLEVGRRGRP